MTITNNRIKIKISQQKGQGVNIILDGSRPFYKNNISKAVYLSNLYLNHEEELNNYKIYVKKILHRVKDKLEKAVLEKREITFVTNYGETIFTDLLVSELKNLFPNLELEKDF